MLLELIHPTVAHFPLQMRWELVHPMIVHFPITLLLTGIFVRFAAYLSGNRKSLSFLFPASWMILGLGVISAWTAVVFGEIARDIVEPTLTSLEVLDCHQKYAYITASSFTIGLFFDFARGWAHKKSENLWFIRYFFAFLVGLFFIGGLLNLAMTGDLGATLVYQEGAAVEK